MTLFLSQNNRKRNLCRIVFEDDDDNTLYAHGDVVEAQDGNYCLALIPSSITHKLKNEFNTKVIPSAVIFEEDFVPLNIPQSNYSLYTVASYSYEVLQIFPKNTVMAAYLLSEEELTKLFSTGKTQEHLPATGIDSSQDIGVNNFHIKRLSLRQPQRYFEALLQPFYNGSAYYDNLCPSGTSARGLEDYQLQQDGGSPKFECSACPDNTYRYGHPKPENSDTEQQNAIPVSSYYTPNSYCWSFHEPPVECSIYNCLEPGSCSLPFSVTQNHTKQHDTVCGCAEGTPFYEIAPIKIDKTFNITEDSIELVDAETISANYQTSDFLCIAATYPCLAETDDPNGTPGFLVKIQDAHKLCYYFSHTNGTHIEAAEPLSIDQQYLEPQALGSCINPLNSQPDNSELIQKSSVAYTLNSEFIQKASVAYTLNSEFIQKSSVAYTLSEYSEPTIDATLITGSTPTVSPTVPLQATPSQSAFFGTSIETEDNTDPMMLVIIGISACSAAAIVGLTTTVVILLVMNRTNKKTIIGLSQKVTFLTSQLQESQKHPPEALPDNTLNPSYNQHSLSPENPIHYDYILHKGTSGASENPLYETVR
ncbi:hypothetical protein GZ78_12140 [Endozoicomonas numazuensis]|uniref:Uncharacterized protein n=1 Tax=Endozoicomonas numazuensis TaxID=1137799 RepID=A0A081NIJ5_9GAMM|nr:hypothetical protein GZ78_12140 [Endozoicomonas numazuensis]